MRTTIIGLLIALGLLVPAVSSAAALSTPQVSAVVALLQAFGVSQGVITNVEQALSGSSDPVDPPSLYVQPSDSLYFSGGIGYDISFNTKAYPVTPFGFAVIGVNGGKAFTDNARLKTEFSWAHFASTVVPTVYLNLNAPYGTTVAGHLGGPKSCPGDTSASQAVASPDGEPTACEGYNYGYNAALHAYAYASEQNITSPIWWLDIEEANSWSPLSSVNDATIQGAIDYLNSRGQKVGIYSVPHMWMKIAGVGFAPTQTIGENEVSIPTWFPIGVKTQVEAINACHTAQSFIPGSPVWIIQYEDTHTSVDKNIAC